MAHQIAVFAENKPGRIERIAGINVEDAYGFVIEDRTRAVLVVDVEKIPEAVGLLKRRGVRTLSDKEIYRL